MSGALRDLREGLLTTLLRGEEREADLVALCDDRHSEPGGPWNAKDHVAHLAAWRDHAHRILIAAARGEQVAEVADIDGFNARIYDEARRRPTVAVREDAVRSYEQLRAAVSAASDALLHRPRPSGLPLWSTVIGNGCEHVAEHLSYWAAAHGDADAAERIATWSCELITESVPEDAAHGVALYNLACFYGRSGRAEEAAPLLERALRLRPELRNFASTDADFDSVRNDDPVRSLFSGG